MLLSEDPDASNARPSQGSNANDTTKWSCPLRSRVGSTGMEPSACGSHTHTVASREPVAKPPPGSATTARTSDAWPRSSARSRYGTRPGGLEEDDAMTKQMNRPQQHGGAASRAGDEKPTGDVTTAKRGSTRQ